MVKQRILLLDADHKNALAILRHLGKTDQYIIDIVSYSKHSICKFSKYSEINHLVCNPKNNTQGYINDLINILRNNKYLVVIPVSYISFLICSTNKEKIREYSKITIADIEKINICNSKIVTYQLAGELNIPYPEIIKINHIDDIEKVEINFPCVIKSPVELGKNVVEYAHSKEDLVSKYRKMCSSYNFGNDLPIVQKFIQGEGAGFFAFYKNGQCINYFMHKRIREYPPKGGASVVAESFYDSQILSDGIKILNELKWEGVAMVEFKKDNITNTFNLMEINAKFWGSLDLALVCGANFPQMMIDDALGNKFELWNLKNKRFQWLLNGDLYYLVERPLHILKFIRELLFSKNDIWISDLAPNIYQLFYIPVHFYKKWFK
jgi:predicted ATP-grasp superfamily ATP-dependent carboligase